MKQFLFLCFAVLVFMFASSYASAGDAELSWMVPDARMDGTQFSANEVERYEVCVFLENDESTECDSIITVPGDKTLINLVGVIPSGGVPAYFKLRLFDKDGLPSGWSNTVSKAEKAPARSITIMIH